MIWLRLGRGRSVGATRPESAKKAAAAANRANAAGALSRARMVPARYTAGRRRSGGWRRGCVSERADA